jgi:flagellin-like protein
MSRGWEYWIETGEYRAVSPVIGVILMVAITVILAAVIGAFVLEIGDQQETAPSTSFASEETVEIFKGGKAQSNCKDDCETNLTTVEITHMGGDVIDISQARIKVDGNNSAYGDPGRVSSYTGGKDPTIKPQPNVIDTLGTNEPVSFTSGNTWSVIGFGGLNKNNIDSSWTGKGPTNDLSWELADGTTWYCEEEDTGEYFNDPENDLTHTGPPWNPTILLIDTSSGGVCADDIDSNNEISVVWTAASGGKTQQLFSYTSQQSNANS